jgi:hypothetical protein
MERGRSSKRSHQISYVFLKILLLLSLQRQQSACSPFFKSFFITYNKIESKMPLVERKIGYTPNTAAYRNITGTPHAASGSARQEEVLGKKKKTVPKCTSIALR